MSLFLPRWLKCFTSVATISISTGLLFVLSCLLHGSWRGVLPTTPNPSAWECSSDSSAGDQLSSFLKRPLSSSVPIASSWFLKVIFCRLSSTGLRTLLSQAHSTLFSFYPVVLFLLSLLRTPSVFTVGILQIFWGGLERWGGRHNPRFYNQGYSAIRIRPSDHHCTANLAFLMVFLVYLVELVVQAECPSGRYAVS